MSPPKSRAPIVTPANPRARPTAIQEVIVIDSDESDEASVRETSPSAKPTSLPSLHSLSWEGESLTSSTDLPIHRTQHRPSNHKHLETPTKKTDIPAPRPRPAPGMLRAPAVKDTVYRRLPVNDFSSALSLLNGQNSANTNPTKTRFSVREIGQKKLDAYISVGAPQQQRPVAAPVAVNRRGVLPVKESVPVPASSPASTSLSPSRGEKRVQLAPRFDSGQRNSGSINQLETPRSTATSTVPVPIPNTPKPVRVKQEPQSNNRQSLPQTPARTRTSKINNDAIRKTRALTSSGTFRDPYTISSDSDSDSDSDNEPPNPRPFQSFAELDNAAGASSPWTENFREREVSVEAVLAEVPTWLDFSSPIPYPIPINSGSTPGHGRQNKRPRNDVGEEKEKHHLSVSSSKDLPSSPLIKIQTATDKSIPIEISSGSSVSSGSGHVVADTRRTGTKRPRNDVSEERHLSRHIPSSPPAVERTATPGSHIIAEISSGFAPGHVVANARLRQNKRPWNDVDEDKHLTRDLLSSPPAAAKKRTVTSNNPIPIISGSSHAVADTRQRQNKRPRSDLVVKDDPPSSVSGELPSSPPTKERTAITLDKCTDHDDRVKSHNKTQLSGDKENKAASRHRNRDRKTWWAQRKLRKQRKVSGGS